MHLKVDLTWEEKEFFVIQMIYFNDRIFVMIQCHNPKGIGVVSHCRWSEFPLESAAEKKLK